MQQNQKTREKHKGTVTKAAKHVRQSDKEQRQHKALTTQGEWRQVDTPGRVR